MFRDRNKCSQCLLILIVFTVVFSHGFSVKHEKDSSKRVRTGKIRLSNKEAVHSVEQLSDDNISHTTTEREVETSSNDEQEKEDSGDGVDDWDSAEKKSPKHKSVKKIGFRAIQKTPAGQAGLAKSGEAGDNKVVKLKDDNSKESVLEEAGVAISETVDVEIKRDLAFDAMTEELDSAGNPKSSGFLQPQLKINDPSNDYYPTFSYHGFYGPNKWYLISTRSFNTDPEKDMGSSVTSQLLQSDMEKLNSMKGKSFLRLKLMKNKESHCRDTNPSPIDIITKNAKEMISFTDFTFHKYDTKYRFQMFIPEDGTDLLVVKLMDASDAFPTITKGSVIGRELTFDSILIRFGGEHKRGSEHYMDGKQFGMELQFLFKTSVPTHTDWWNLGETVNYFMNPEETDNDPQIKKHFLILSVFVEVKNEDETIPDSENNEGLIYLSQAAKRFWGPFNKEKKRGFKSKLTVLSLKQFFDIPKKGLYYTYDGSLSFPPCLNFFRWSVFAKPIVTDFKTWQGFQFVPSEFSDTGYMADNFRPFDSIFINKPKEVKNRTIYDLIPYLDPIMKESISMSVSKSRPSSDKDKKDDYDYYEDDEKGRLLTGRLKNIRSSTSTLFIPAEFFKYNFVFLLAMFLIASFVTVSE